MRNFIIKIDAGKGEKIYWGWLDSQDVIHFSQVNWLPEHGSSHFRAKLFNPSVSYTSTPGEVMADAYELNHQTIFPLELPEAAYRIFH